jgi:hypothetical protein
LSEASANINTTPASRPFRLRKPAELQRSFLQALSDTDGQLGAHCVHELWMRGEMAANVEAMLESLWKACGPSVPDWLPMRHISWLPQLYEIAGEFKATGKGRSNIYLVLLDYNDRRAGPYGVYVGMTSRSPAERFDQHKSGIRAAGSVLKRGLELLAGPAMHLRRIRRADAARIEKELAERLADAGFIVEGGH